MRITQSETYRNFTSDLGNLNESYNNVSRQLSSGKALTQLSDSPADSADLLSLTSLSADINQYQSNADSVAYVLKSADSALNEVNNIVSTVYSKGSQATSEIYGDDERAALATEIRSLQDQILSLANTQVNGRYIFAGSKSDSKPFILNDDGSVDYKGDSEVNSVRIDQETEVQTGVAGSEAFTAVFSSISSLLSAIDQNDVSAIAANLQQFQLAYSELGTARGKIGSGMNTIEAVQSHLGEQETNMKARRSQIEDADMAEAAVQLSQTQTAMNAAMSAGGSVLTQRNLFDILG